MDDRSCLQNSLRKKTRFGERNRALFETGLKESSFPNTGRPGRFRLNPERCGADGLALDASSLAPLVLSPAGGRNRSYRYSLVLSRGDCNLAHSGVRMNRDREMRRCGYEDRGNTGASLYGGGNLDRGIKQQIPHPPGKVAGFRNDTFG
jgi:hypothetical protein